MIITMISQTYIILNYWVLVMLPPPMLVCERLNCRTSRQACINT